MTASQATMGPALDTSALVQRENSKVDSLKGLGILDTGEGFVKDINDAEAKRATGEYGQAREILEFATDGVCLALDALGVVMNPLGELGKAGAGFLIEHVDFVREGLEVITGDPEEVKAIAASWEEITKRLNATHDEYQSALNNVSGWSGSAGDGYRQAAHHYLESLKAAAKQAEGAKSCVENAGLAVATVRGLVFDVIAEFVGRLIGQALAAAAAAVFTLGASAAAFIAGAVAQACSTATKIMTRLKKLVAAMEKFSEMLKRFSEAAKKYRSISENRQLINNAVNPMVVKANKFGEQVTEYVGPVGTIASHKGTTATKEFVKAATDVDTPENKDGQGR